MASISKASSLDSRVITGSGSTTRTPFGSPRSLTEACPSKGLFCWIAQENRFFSPRRRLSGWLASSTKGSATVSSTI